MLQAENEVEQQEWMEMLQVGAGDERRGAATGTCMQRHEACLSRRCRVCAWSLQRWPRCALLPRPPQGVIACLLTGEVDQASIPTRPARPTHSRT